VAAFAVADDEVAFAGRDAQVSQVEGHDLGDAQPGVEAGQGDGPISGGGLLGGS